MSVYALVGAAIGWWTATGEKSQAMRLLDVVMVGPALLFTAPRPIRDLIGGATITYNLRNYIIQQRRGIISP